MLNRVMHKIKRFEITSSVETRMEITYAERLDSQQWAIICHHSCELLNMTTKQIAPWSRDARY